MSQDEVTEELNFYHSTPVGRHSGVSTTLGKILQHYTWSGMKDVVEYVGTSWSVPFYITQIYIIWGIFTGLILLLQLGI
jgi:hypothetical protein